MIRGKSRDFAKLRQSLGCLRYLFFSRIRGASRSRLVTFSRFETAPRLDPTRRDISRRDVSEISPEISIENSQKAARDQGKGAGKGAVKDFLKGQGAVSST